MEPRRQRGNGSKIVGSAQLIDHGRGESPSATGLTQLQDISASSLLATDHSAEDRQTLGGYRCLRSRPPDAGPDRKYAHTETRNQGGGRNQTRKLPSSELSTIREMPDFRTSCAYDLPSAEELERFQSAKSRLVDIVDDILQTLRSDCASPDILSHYSSALNWLNASRTDLYGRDAEAEVLEMTDDELLTALSNAEHAVTKPVVLRMQSGSTMAILDFCRRLQTVRQWKSGLIEVQDRSANLTTNIDNSVPAQCIRRGTSACISV